MGGECQVRKAIVTGGTGFIGSNLCKHLIENAWEVSVLVRSSSNLCNINNIINKIEILEYDGNINQLIHYFKEAKADVVFHLAAFSNVEHNPDEIDRLLESNIKFGLHILEAMKESQTKLLINTGTYWQHYHSDEYNPVNLYAATKQAFESLIKYYIEAENISAITLKLFDTYGESDTRHKLINLLHKFADENKELNMSPGEQVLDLVHVEDVVSAYLKAYDYLIDNESIKFEDFAVATGRKVKLKELIKVFEKVSSKKINVIWGGRDYRKREVMNPLDGYTVLPNWEPRISLEEGLKRLADKGL